MPRVWPSARPDEISDFLLQKSWTYIRSEPLQWVRLLEKKWLMVWNAREVEDSDDFYIYSKWSLVLTILGWITHFGVLAPLAALGIVGDNSALHAVAVEADARLKRALHSLEKPAAVTSG